MNATGSPLKIAFQRGLIGGIIAVLISLIGMVQAFNVRDFIGGVIPLGVVLLYVTYFGAAYAAALNIKPRRVPEALLIGLVSGAASGILMGAMILLFNLVNLREAFLNASPEMFAILMHGQPLGLGILLLIATSTVIGIIAALLAVLPAKIQQIIVRSLMILLLTGLLSGLLKIITTQWGVVGTKLMWLFSGSGLSPLGAIFFVAISLAWQIWQSRQPPKPARSFTLRPRKPLDWIRLVIIMVVLLALPYVMGQYVSEVLDQVGIYILMGLGLNIVVGFAGLLDLGYVAFYAIGAYTMGVLTSPELGYFNLSFWVAVPIAVLVAVFAGVLLGIPVLKMRGDYLAIVTLGFGEIIRIMALSDVLKPYINGPQGIQQIAKPTIGPIILADQRSIYYLILAAIIIAGFVAIRLRDSRMGRTWMAMREDEDVAQAQGINLVATKLAAFATGAAFSGLSGAIFASKLGSAYPQSFKLMVSINVLAVIIVGGMGSIPGVFIGSLFLVGLPELLREFAEFRELVYGAVLVIMMLYKPEGLLPEQSHERELHADQVPIAIEQTSVTPEQ